MQSLTVIDQHLAIFYHLQVVNDSPINIPNENFLEPDTFGFMLTLIASALIFFSFFSIIQNLILEKTLLHSEKNLILKSFIVLTVPIFWFVFTEIVWLTYIAWANAFFKDYEFPLEFFLYHPKVLLKGLLIGNIVPSFIALYSTFLLSGHNQNVKDKKLSEIGKKASIWGMIFNLINLIGSIVTIFVFIKS